METGRKRGPDRGPRKRFRGKIAGGKAEKAVKKCLLNGGTLAEASRLVTRIEGKSVSKQSVSRYYRRLLEAAERTRMMDGLARALSEKSSANGWNIGWVSREMLLARALEAVALLPDDAMSNLPADRLARLLCHLLRASAEADRHEHWAYMCNVRPGQRGQSKSDAGREPAPDQLAATLRDLMRGFGGRDRLGGPRNRPGGPPGGPGGPPSEADKEPGGTEGGG